MKNRLNVFLYGILAGAAIALGGILFILVNTLIPNNLKGFEDLPKLAGALVFPVGLLLVCYFKFNLYTGKIGMAFRNKKLDKKGLNTWEWLALILVGNAVGAMAVGAIIFLFTLIDKESAFSTTVYAVGNSRAMAFDFTGIFNMTYKSILCGALVYIAIYFFNQLDNNFGKVVGIIAPISFFVYAGFQHCIANMFYIAAGAQWNLNAFIGLLICIVGNSVGALLLDLLVKYE